MNKILIICVALTATALLAAGQDGKASAKGDAVFAKLCVNCHGADGKAQTEMGTKVQAADLTSKSVQDLSESRMVEVVTKGNQKMPAFGDKLSSSDIRNVVAYVRQFGKP
jgi:cbb3-type cytochrome c oxidase subunit III